MGMHYSDNPDVNVKMTIYIHSYFAIKTFNRISNSEFQIHTNTFFPRYINFITRIAYTSVAATNVLAHSILTNLRIHFTFIDICEYKKLVKTEMYIISIGIN